ncbi:MAG: hypothetical protein GY820_28200 [Gammaproteobacteria bacterium]|nr:hypothetical protein [Gammaproteobacteria bacterium]
MNIYFLPQERKQAVQERRCTEVYDQLALTWALLFSSRRCPIWLLIGQSRRNFARTSADTKGTFRSNFFAINKLRLEHGGADGARKVRS